MNEKKQFTIASIISFIVYTIAITAFILTGCITPRQSISTDTPSTTRLETTINTIDSILDDSTNRITTITEASKSITDGITRVEYLFTEYEREVNNLRAELTDLRNSLTQEE